MNQKPTALIALIAWLSAGLSTPAAECQVNAPSVAAQDRPALAAPAILTQNESLDTVEMRKYEHLATQSQHLAASKAAGSSTRTTLIVVGVIVVAATVITLANSNLGSGLPAYTGPM